LAAWLDKTPVLGWVLGSIGVIWLPVVVGFVVALLLDGGQKYPTICWAGGLVGVQVLAGVVAHLVKKHQELEKGIAEVIALRHFLDWMHAEVFNKKTNTRITVMVPVKGKNGQVLRSFLRPSEFPSKSKTELAIQCNTGTIEGVAGLAYCHSGEQRIVLPDPEEDLEEYARLSYVPVAKVRSLERKARFYLALPIENTTGPHAGVLVVDHGKYPRIVDSEKPTHSDRAEERTRLFVGWVALRLRAIPTRIRERA